MKLGVIAADEPALKEVLSCKGHAGMRPRVLRANASLPKTELHEHSDYAMSICDVDYAKFVKHSDDTVREVVRR